MEDLEDSESAGKIWKVLVMEGQEYLESADDGGPGRFGKCR